MYNRRYKIIYDRYTSNGLFRVVIMCADGQCYEMYQFACSDDCGSEEISKNIYYNEEDALEAADDIIDILESY